MIRLALRIHDIFIPSCKNLLNMSDWTSKLCVKENNPEGSRKLTNVVCTSPWRSFLSYFTFITKELKGLDASAKRNRKLEQLKVNGFSRFCKIDNVRVILSLDKLAQ